MSYKSKIGAGFILLLAIGYCSDDPQTSSAYQATKLDNQPKPTQLSQVYSTPRAEPALYSRYVATENLNVRHRPNGSKVSSVKFGDTVQIYESRPGWVRISKTNDASKWVSSTYLSVTRPVRRQTIQPSYSNSQPSRSAYYKNCTEARNAGVAPIYRGQAGYRRALDRDNDGVACE